MKPWLAALLMGMGWCSCTVRLDVPPGIQVTCDSQGQCPSGFVCRAELGRCVSSSDAARPGPLSAVKAPLVLGSSQRLEVLVKLDQPSNAAPTVTWLQGSATASLQPGPSRAEPDTYASWADVAADFVDGPTQLIVTAQDLYGNVRQTVVAGPALDLTAPAAQSIGWFDEAAVPLTKTLVGLGEVVRAQAVVSRDSALQAASLSTGVGGPVIDLTSQVVISPTNTALTLGVRLDTAALTSPALFHGAVSFTLVDPAGNVATVSTPTLTFDLAAPSVQVTQAPAASTTQTSAVFSFVSPAADLDHFECALDGAAFAACVSPLTLDRLSVGPHLLSVRARDAAGNLSAAVDTSWTVVRVWDRVFGRYEPCAIASDQSLWCSGRPLGDGTNNTSTSLRRVPLSVRVRDFAGGGARCAVGVDESVWCWGHWPTGEWTTPVQVLPPGRCVKLAMSDVVIADATACSLRHDGRVECWGDNYFGALGNGTFGSGTASITPVLVGGPTDRFVDLAGGDGIYAVAVDGTLWGWGQQLGTIDGRPHLKDSSTDWQSITADTYTVCGTRGAGDGGTPFCMGANDQGQILLPTAGSVSSFTAAATSADYLPGLSLSRDDVCGLRAIDGGTEAWCRGGNAFGALGTALPSGPKDFVKALDRADVRSVASSGDGVCATTSTGELWCWGQVFATFGTLVGPTVVHDGLSWLQVWAASPYSACGVTQDHDVYTWGRWNGATFPLTDTGFLPNPVRVTADHDWSSISCGELAACGIRAHQAYCFGDNTYGTLGRPQGSPASSSAPVAVDANTDWESVAIGGNVACGLRSQSGARHLYCWGVYSATTWPSSAATPKLVDAASWASFSVTSDQVCGIHVDGTLWCATVSSDGSISAPSQPSGTSAFSDYLAVSLSSNEPTLSTIRDNGGLHTGSYLYSQGDGFLEVGSGLLGIAVDGGALISGGAGSVIAPGPLHGLSTSLYAGCALTAGSERLCFGQPFMIGDGNASHTPAITIAAEQTP